MADVVLPSVDMVPNPDFAFPARPLAAHGHTRPMSVHDITATPHRPSDGSSWSTPAASHRRAASTLPSFRFNATDVSGRSDDGEASPTTPTLGDEATPALATPTRRGHRRGGSEFVGGDSRLGVTSALSASPTKSSALPVPILPTGPSAGRRGHAHRRSAAISSHDVSSLMYPADVQPRLSSSLPNTPLDHPALSPLPVARAFSTSDVQAGVADPFGPPLEANDGRPPSSRRVGFADNVTFIPRPLSTISSETESSMSTIRGHSVNNSISSVLSLGTPSPPSMRAMTPSLTATLEDEPTSRKRASLEISKRVEKEGEWLTSRSSSSLRRHQMEAGAVAPVTTFVLPEMPARVRALRKRGKPLSYSQAPDRRKSEPAIAIPSAESLHGPADIDTVSDEHVHRPSERLTSTRKFKAWATSMMGRKHRGMHRQLRACSSASSIRPASVEEEAVPGMVSRTEVPIELVAAETDLDAVLSDMPAASGPQWSHSVQPRADSSLGHSTSQCSDDTDEEDAMLDLDDALGPAQTTSSAAGSRQRRELHSSRLTKDFSGPGGHYHRRAESAPLLSPFEYSPALLQQPSMDDVFEEEEEEGLDEPALPTPSSGHSHPSDESPAGVQQLGPDSPSATGAPFSWSVAGGLGFSRGSWEPERLGTTYSNPAPRYSSLAADRRGSSIAEEVIHEEISPGEDVEIVEAHEEPRASSLTKSSDSSEAPTLLGQATDFFAPPTTAPCSMSLETYEASNFSSPDLGRNECSFETSRLGTSASSMTDNRTVSSYATGEHGHDNRVSVDDVPSLTSSRSTMLSSMHMSGSRRDFSNASRERTPSASSGRMLHPAAAAAAAMRRKRSSIQSLSQLVGGPFGSKLKLVDDARPQTADTTGIASTVPKKEHRLKKLMFWRSKHTTTRLQTIAPE